MGTAVGAAGARSDKAGLTGRLGTPGENGCRGDGRIYESVLLTVIEPQYIGNVGASLRQNQCAWLIGETGIRAGGSDKW